MSLTKHLRVTFAFTLALIWPVLAQAQTDKARPEWTPPPARQVKALFAPKPTAGNNIFQGEAEIWLADAIDRLSGEELAPIDDKAISEYVTKVGNYLVTQSVNPTKQYHFIVTDDSSANAMTGGGGRIYINWGMLEVVANEDELAGVLAHEIAHDAFGHTPKTITRQMFWMTGKKKVTTPEEVEAALRKLLEEYEKKPAAATGENLLGFRRFDELAADRAAFYNIYQAGYNPRALANLLQRLEKPEKAGTRSEKTSWQQLVTILLGSHPPTAQRNLALAWETNFVKMPAQDLRYDNAAFAAMKTRVAGQ